MKNIYWTGQEILTSDSLNLNNLLLQNTFSNHLNSIPYYWGINKLIICDKSLDNNILKIKYIEGVTQQGELFQYDSNWLYCSQELQSYIYPLEIELSKYNEEEIIFFLKISDYQYIIKENNNTKYNNNNQKNNLIFNKEQYIPPKNNTNSLNKILIPKLEIIDQDAKHEYLPFISLIKNNNKYSIGSYIPPIMNIVNSKPLRELIYFTLSKIAINKINIKKEFNLLNFIITKIKILQELTNLSLHPLSLYKEILELLFFFQEDINQYKYDHRNLFLTFYNLLNEFIKQFFILFPSSSQSLGIWIEQINSPHYKVFVNSNSNICKIYIRISNILPEQGKDWIYTSIICDENSLEHFLKNKEEGYPRKVIEVKTHLNYENTKLGYNLFSVEIITPKPYNGNLIIFNPRKLFESEVSIYGEN